MIDEVDSATNHQVFLDFLAQLRACYIYRDIQITFKSVILAGVYDIKNLKNKINPDGDGKANSPWNIAADFTVDMSFTEADIAEMQQLDMYKASLQDKNQFIVDGHLNMRFVLERFALHFNDLYGDKGNTFIEEEGRKYFLLYLRPIINGTGNYYIETNKNEKILVFPIPICYNNIL